MLRAWWRMNFAYLVCCVLPSPPLTPANLLVFRESQYFIFVLFAECKTLYQGAPGKNPRLNRSRRSFGWGGSPEKLQLWNAETTAHNFNVEIEKNLFFTFDVFKYLWSARLFFFVIVFHHFDLLVHWNINFRSGNNSARDDALNVIVIALSRPIWIRFRWFPSNIDALFVSGARSVCRLVKISKRQNGAERGSKSSLKFRLSMLFAFKWIKH